MYLSALSDLNSDETERLESLLQDCESEDTLVVCAASSDSQHLAWMSRRNGETREGCGVLTGFGDGAIEISEHGTKIFAGDRTPYSTFLDNLPRDEREGWSRETFHKDCRALGAFGLHQEQQWCEAAFAHDGNPETPSVYVVQVLGSARYFGYFNILWEPDDFAALKSCHDLQRWASLYVPRMYADRDVERWVFLCQEDLEAFANAAPDYRRAFTLKPFPFSGL